MVLGLESAERQKGEFGAHRGTWDTPKSTAKGLGCHQRHTEDRVPQNPPCAP